MRIYESGTDRNLDTLNTSSTPTMPSPTLTPPPYAPSAISSITPNASSTPTTLSLTYTPSLSAPTTAITMAAASQLKLPQHRVDAEDSNSSHDFRVLGPVLPSHPPYSAKAVKVDVAELSGMAGVDGPGARSIEKCLWQDDGPVWCSPDL
ncbi:hypothetical protein SprV_0200925200 [Sparganum proliferum]